MLDRRLTILSLIPVLAYTLFIFAVGAWFLMIYPLAAYIAIRSLSYYTTMLITKGRNRLRLKKILLFVDVVVFSALAVLTPQF